MNANNWFVGYSDANGVCTPSNRQSCPLNVPITFRATQFAYPIECAPHSFSWNFGDGTAATGQIVTKTFTRGGDFNVSVTINNGAQSFTATAPVKIQQPAAQPKILSFTATPSSIRAGQQVTLSFVTADATSVVIDGIGAQNLSGSVTVTPGTTTTYTLRAMSGSQSVTETVRVEVIEQPSLSATTLPGALVQQAGTAGATTTYTLVNNGGAATNVTLTQSGDFFTQSPTSFTLARGASQTVTVTAAARSAGTYDGVSFATGTGVPAGLQIPIRLVSSAPPNGPTEAKPSDNRVDTFGAATSNPTGSTRVTNVGSATLTAAVTADVPWIVPQASVITIAPGATETVSFSVDRSKRPDAGALIGSANGNLLLTYLSGTAAGKGRIGVDQLPGSFTKVTPVSVVDTAPPPTRAGALPPLAAGEIAVFIAGLGHVRGSVGQFISDISIVNTLSSREINDLRLFYTATTGGGDAKTADLPLATGRSIKLGDVVKTTFEQETQGTLQLRSRDADKLAVSASVFNTGNGSGTFGTALPIIRSDRAAGPGEPIVLTGLRRDASSHTNLYIQEVSGTSINVRTEFFTADGSSVSTRSDSIGAFGLVQIGRVVPEGAVSAILTTDGGRFQAFATPVDTASGDTWTVADWSRILGYATNSVTVIPVGGVLAGAANTFFRTDMAVMNRGTAPAVVEIRFIGRNGENIPRSITLGVRQSVVLSNVVGDFIGAPNGSVGYLAISPIGDVATSSRTYTTVAGQSATYGTGVPVIAIKDALKRGAVRVIASLDDAEVATVQAQRPSSFRTNFGLMETSGASSRVRVTVKFRFPAGLSVSGDFSTSKDYDLNPYQFLLVNGLTADVIGPQRANFDDLENVTATFQVLEGDGSVLVFTSSVDNGTGDTILRVE